MNVEQAIYGASRDGHGLRKTSRPDRLFNELESRLDLPDTPPPGAEWSPFLRGFPFGEHYILARTFADPTATRTGFVLTHAVVAPLPEITALNDLRPLLALLIQAPQPPEGLTPREVSVSAGEPANSSGLTATAEALTTRGTGPVVWIGLEGFDELVVALWFRLWPELRANFAFRLSFGPSDWRDKDTPSLVCSPQSLSSRWSGYRVVGQTTPARSSSAAAMLSGRATMEPILAFAREIGARMDELGNLPLLQRAYELWFAPEPTFEDCVSMLRLMEGLSPDPAAGVVTKEELVRRTEARLGKAAVEEVHRLRNMRMAAFPTAVSLWRALASWMAQNEYVQSHDPAVSAILRDAVSSSAAVKDWQKAILHGIRAAASSDSPSFARAFWRWADSSPAILADVAVHLPNLGDLEKRLVETAPRETKREAGSVVMAIAASKRWWYLHGTAAGASLPPRDALLSQLAADPSAVTLKAIQATLQRATPEQVLALALEVGESIVLDVAAELVAGNPHLLRDIALSHSSAQTVWARAIGINPAAWSGPVNPGKEFVSILHKLIDGGSISEEVITTLATTPLADLGDCPRRPEIWGRVSGSVREQLLRATANGWLARALAHQVVENLETPLEDALLTKTSLEMELRVAASTKPGIAIRIALAVARFDESRFLPCVDSFFTGRVRLTAAEADALGNLILRRRWQRVVDRLLQLARAGHHEVKPVLSVCVDMVDWLSKWWLGISPPSPETSWRVLEELASELYSSGPDHEELWSRAGGKPSDIQKNGSGQARWHDALAQIRRGKEPGIDKLLHEMARDFPKNEHLRRLKNDSSFQTAIR